jgi:hypothetical protein
MVRLDLAQKVFHDVNVHQFFPTEDRICVLQKRIRVALTKGLASQLF